MRSTNQRKWKSNGEKSAKEKKTVKTITNVWFVFPAFHLVLKCKATTEENEKKNKTLQIQQQYVEILLFVCYTCELWWCRMVWLQIFTTINFQHIETSFVRKCYLNESMKQKQKKNLISWNWLGFFFLFVCFEF